MNKTLVAFLGAVLLAAAGAPAPAQRPPVTVLEGSVETSADQVVFPSSLAGKIDVRGGQSLQLGPDTQFVAGGKVVSLQAMAAYASGAGSTPLTIHYRLKDSVVSRVMILGK
jgi:hypothetical protein